ncbi:17341_t:CDS:10 [Rhizophagus irregularis]|nr:17341_t:CDS:10 [Rhizophagus irregularis]
MATLYRSFNTSISRILEKSTNRIAFSPLYKPYLTSSLKRYGVFSRSTLEVKGWVYSPEVFEALQGNKPLVALESTVISHGMQYPQNLETAVAIENIVRENGSIPATIAILNGKINLFQPITYTGLSSNGLETLAQMGQKARKSSRRDLAYVVSQGLTGSTTVSGTMVIAHRAGIRVFVTGGIGGVHWGAEKSMDVSADLVELGRTPVAVVCAGVKSILDIEKTLEYLETQGVSVTTFGETRDFPAFFTPRSGFMCAALIDANIQLQLNSGMLIAVPIPENEAADANKIQEALSIALAEAKEISGKDITPFLLKRINEITQGDSLKSNISLLKNNAKIGSQIAKCLLN